MRQSCPSAKELWKKHESNYCAIFVLALKELANKNNINGNECAISEALNPLFPKICLSWSTKKNKEINLPIWNAPISPASDEELKGGKKNKIPDFTCQCINRFTEKPDEYQISFHIECKCLGNSTSSSWKLNENYVTDGIERFDSKTHEYGKGASSGMMIGYIVSMEPEKILDEVNSYQRKHFHNFTKIVIPLNQGPTFEGRQNLRREYVKPKNFTLIHMWVDLRKNYLHN